MFFAFFCSLRVNFLSALLTNLCSPPHITLLQDQHVSAALAKGVRYNMKILIRGQRKTGKTQLLRRLQGLDFIAEYTPTPEITTAHLIWTCPATDEKVKVEFWDVVDKGMQPSTTWAGVTGGKGGEPAEASQQENVVLLDAETIDVNRGCDGVILVHDPSRPETLAYCLALLRDIRAEVPALIVSSFADSRRAVKSKELATAIKQHSLCASLSVCAKDGFGVDLVRDFLTVPFLAIKQRYALRLLSSAKEAIGTTRTRLDTFGDTLNFAAHCQQWSAGGAALAAQQAARMQAVHKAAAAAAPGVVAALLSFTQLYSCFTPALLMLYCFTMCYCFTQLLLVQGTSRQRQRPRWCPSRSSCFPRV